MKIALALCLIAGPAFAQAPGGPPPGFFPAGMPNTGDLWVEFCLIGKHVCSDTEAKIWGQVCTSYMADEVVNGPKENASHINTPLGMRFVGWRCGKDGELIVKDRGGFYNNGKFIESKETR